MSDHYTGEDIFNEFQKERESKGYGIKQEEQRE